MRRYISYFGRTKVVIITTIVALLLALTCTLIFEYCLHQIGINVHPAAAVFIATWVTLIITPIMSWHFIGLMVKIDQLEEEMRALATYDSLTGLFSRREFIERAGYYFKVAKREKHEFSLIIVDIDDFKGINDQYGHISGDQALKSFGEAVRTTFRESDIASRFGGDEFVFFLPNTSSRQAQMFTERLHSKIREGVKVAGSQIHYTASMGLATYPEVAISSIDKIIIAADKALYHAKNNGGDQTHVFNPTPAKKSSMLFSFNTTYVYEEMGEDQI